MLSGAVGIGWVALLVVAGVGYWLWDRHRYRGADGPRDAFQPSGERFVDPATGRRVRVYVDPATGRRQYREEDGGGPGGGAG